VGLPGTILAGVLLAGCVAEGAGPTVTPSAGAGVKIRTAPGERLAFQPAEVKVRAAGPITVTFQNRSELAHNMTFTGPITAATRTIVSAGTSDQLVIVPPGPGPYPFVCTIHDGMAGTLIVEPAASGE
jgi:plastocyanin